MNPQVRVVVAFLERYMHAVGLFLTIGGWTGRLGVCRNRLHRGAGGARYELPADFGLIADDAAAERLAGRSSPRSVPPAVRGPRGLVFIGAMAGRRSGDRRLRRERVQAGVSTR